MVRILLLLIVFGTIHSKESFENFKSYEDLRSYLEHPIKKENLELADAFLKPYLVLRWNLFLAKKEVQKIKPFGNKNFFFIKKIKNTHGLKLSELIILDPPKIKLRFFIKYKGVKQTKEKRPSLLLNFLAREGEIAEGFEASENLSGAIEINKQHKITSYIGVFEKWVHHRKDDDKTFYLTMDHPDVKKDTRLTGTVKYSLGWSYQKPMIKEKKLHLDFLIQQKASSHWKYTERVFTRGDFSGVLFDHWVLTGGVTF